MPTFEFVLDLGPGRELGRDEIDALYEAGFDDSGVETGPVRTLIDVAREAVSWEAAVSSAVAAARRVLGRRADFIEVVGEPSG